jgi:hypothetical protein
MGLVFVSVVGYGGGWRERDERETRIVEEKQVDAEISLLASY